MKIADITTPGDYEVGYTGHRVTIVAVEKRTRQIYTGERGDWNGHSATGKVAVSDTGTLYTPQQILRTWAKAQSSLDKTALRKDEQDRIVRDLNRELGKLGALGSVRYASTNFGHYERSLTDITISLTNEQAATLSARLKVRP